MKSMLMSRQRCAQPDGQKVKCAFHQGELLTNFCSCESCLLPLCPSCIKIHISEHLKMGTAPELDNINDVLSGVQEELAHFGELFNASYKNIVEFQSNADQFKHAILNKVVALKDELIKGVELHFNKMLQATSARIGQMQVVRGIQAYKQQTKKIILSLKQIDRNFWVDHTKLMRTVIKYEANRIQESLETFYVSTSKFLGQVDKNFVTVSLREDYSSNFLAGLDNAYKMEFHDMQCEIKPIDISPMLRELYEKHGENKDIKKSLSHLLNHKQSASKGTPKREDYDTVNCSRGELAENINHPIPTDYKGSTSVQSILQDHREIANELRNYNSLAQEHRHSNICNQSFQLSRNLKPQDRQDVRRRSSSKGKGLSIMQIGNISGDLRKGPVIEDSIDLSILNTRKNALRRCR